MNRYIIQWKKYFHEILNIQKKKKKEKNYYSTDLHGSSYRLFLRSHYVWCKLH